MSLAGIGLPGFDKAQHFGMTYAASVFAYAAARSSGIDRRPSLNLTIGAAALTGIGKELLDRRSGRPFSTGDLLADALGGAAAYAVLKQVR